MFIDHFSVQQHHLAASLTQERYRELLQRSEAGRLIRIRDEGGRTAPCKTMEGRNRGEAVTLTKGTIEWSLRKRRLRRGWS